MTGFPQCSIDPLEIRDRRLAWQSCG